MFENDVGGEDEFNYDFKYLTFFFSNDTQYPPIGTYEEEGNDTYDLTPFSTRIREIGIAFLE